MAPLWTRKERWQKHLPRWYVLLPPFLPPSFPPSQRPTHPSFVRVPITATTHPVLPSFLSSFPPQVPFRIPLSRLTLGVLQDEVPPHETLRALNASLVGLHTLPPSVPPSLPGIVHRDPSTGLAILLPSSSSPSPPPPPSLPRPGHLPES